jgi:hypothetical protein
VPKCEQKAILQSIHLALQWLSRFSYLVFVGVYNLHRCNTNMNHTAKEIKALYRQVEHKMGI